ncbi:hypothetical protein D031_2380A, partial [Vibrio parahaemolyticus VP-48]
MKDTFSATVNFDHFTGCWCSK